MSISTPTYPSRFRFALATLLSRLAFRVCPSEFNNRFCEEVEELIEEEVIEWSPEQSNNWTADGTQRIPSDGRWKQGW